MCITYLKWLTLKSYNVLMNKKRIYLIVFVVIIILSAVNASYYIFQKVEAASFTPWSGILASNRAIDWSTAGVVGGVPSDSWSQCGTTIVPYNGTADVINNAITSCSPNHYVQLGSGTFNLTTGINMVSNVELRGVGANQ